MDASIQQRLCPHEPSLAGIREALVRAETERRNLALRRSAAESKRSNVHRLFVETTFGFPSDRKNMSHLEESEAMLDAATAAVREADTDLTLLDATIAKLRELWAEMVVTTSATLTAGALK